MEREREIGKLVGFWHPGLPQGRAKVPKLWRKPILQPRLEGV